MNDWISKNAYLSTAEQQNNAAIIWNFFGSLGWTANAVSAMLGNMESESTINPGIWESLTVNYSRGFGLVQWTPATKYIDWAGSQWENGDKQCERIIWELENGGQWYPTSQYPLTFKEFSVSTEPPAYLADAFLKNYERPADPDQPNRGTQAEIWYTFITGLPPPHWSRVPIWILFKLSEKRWKR